MENGMNLTAAVAEIEETFEEHAAHMRKISDEVKADIKAGRYRHGQIHPHIRGDYARGTVTGRWPEKFDHIREMSKADSFADLYLGKWESGLMETVKEYSNRDMSTLLDSFFKPPRGYVMFDESHHIRPESMWIRPTKDKDWDQKKFTSGPATTPSEATRIKRREERNRKRKAKK